MTFKNDPFWSKVHPLFWPVLWISLRWLARWTGEEIAAGRGDWFLQLEVTWYGQIQILAHIAPDWNAKLAPYRGTTTKLLSQPRFNAPHGQRPGAGAAAPAANSPEQQARGAQGKKPGATACFEYATGPPQPPNAIAGAEGALRLHHQHPSLPLSPSVTGLRPAPPPPLRGGGKALHIATAPNRSAKAPAAKRAARTTLHRQFNAPTSKAQAQGPPRQRRIAPSSKPEARREERAASRRRAGKQARREETTKKPRRCGRGSSF